MATHRERILGCLREHPTGLDDDQLAHLLGITHRQTVNQECRRLASQGIVVRQVSAESGKIINQLVENAMSAPVANQSLCQLPPDTPSASVVRVVELRDAVAVQGFAYAGELQISEDAVKKAVAAVLHVHGWSVDTRWGKTPGIDIDARRGIERLVLEAKGEGSLPAMRVNYFVGALGELAQRMESPELHYGLALPAHRQFINLVLRLPEWVRSHLHLCFFFVRPVPGADFDVGIFIGDRFHL